MNELEKSLEHARLMKWKLVEYGGRSPIYKTIVAVSGGHQHRDYFEPYRDTTAGRAQFAAILLDNAEVMDRFHTRGNPAPRGSMATHKTIKPTQESLLDEILRMKGVKI